MSAVAQTGSAPAARGEARNRLNTHPRALKILHWLTAALVLSLFASGIIMTQLGGGPAADWLYPAHKLTGATVLLLLWIRLAWRALPGSRAHVAGGHWAHAALYAAAVATGVLGWAGVSDFGARQLFFGLSLPAVWPEGAGYYAVFLRLHAWLAFGLIALVVLHIAAAMRHHVTRGRN